MLIFFPWSNLFLYGLHVLACFILAAHVEEDLFFTQTYTCYHTQVLVVPYK